VGGLMTDEYGHGYGLRYELTSIDPQNDSTR
jgi:hypothetical protein